MPVQTFIVNGKTVSLDVNPDVRVLWVLRDLLGVTGPKYGCGINVCKACTSHINGRAFNPCSVRIGDILPNDRIDTIEGLPATIGAPAGSLHPMQQAWLDRDVPQCGYCQPGQIMAAVALVKKTRRENREITENDLDNIRNICRCGTYVRIRSAIMQGAANMTAEMSATTGTKPAVATSSAKKKKRPTKDAKDGGAITTVAATTADNLPNTGAPNLGPVIAAGVAAVLAGDVLRRKGGAAAEVVVADGPATNGPTDA